MPEPVVPGAEGGTPPSPPAPPPHTPAPPPGAGTPPPAPPAPPPPPAAAGGEDGVVDADGYIRLSQSAFKARITRANKAYLEDTFGVTDPEVLRGKLSQAETLAKEAEERRLAQLSKEERLAEENRKLIAERDEARAAAARTRDYATAQQVGHQVSTAISQHVAPKYKGYAEHEFRTYVESLSDDEAARLDDAAMNAWFKGFAEQNPALALAGPPPPAAPPPARAPVNYGAPPGGPPGSIPSGGSSQTKTAKPGQPNSMSPEEWNAWKRANGVSY